MGPFGPSPTQTFFGKGKTLHTVNNMIYNLEKFETMTGTGRAMTRTPEREQTEPMSLPIIVFGTISPYLKQKYL